MHYARLSVSAGLLVLLSGCATDHQRIVGSSEVFIPDGVKLRQERPISSLDDDYRHGFRWIDGGERPAMKQRDATEPARANAALTMPPEIGIASWYGRRFHGRRTATGERYDMRAMTAAHRTLPFGAKVRVTCLDSGRVVEVRINDRGPFVRNRIIDLSHGAAKHVGLVGTGSARVRIDVLEIPQAEPEAESTVERNAMSYPD